MLKGIEKNLIENYNKIVSLKKIDQIKSKEDVPILEAFELYMLKNFHNIKLNSNTIKILNVWEKDFDKSIFNHIEFLKKNLSDQNTYSAHFSKILEEMDIFEPDDNKNPNEENQEDNQNSLSNENDESDNQDKIDRDQHKETEASLVSDYEIDQYELDENLMESESENQNSDQILQKKNLKNLNMRI